MERKLIQTEESSEDLRFEPKIRPKMLSDYIGQEKLKEMLSIYIEAAKKRKQSLDHCLFYGPPGLGKTTISNIIANELGVHCKITSGPAIEKPGEMAAILNSLSEGDVLFVDEIHRLNRQVEEVLYPAMEDFAIDVLLGKESSTRSLRLELPHFTLIGATTRAGLLSAPLRDRFGIISKLEFYNKEELTRSSFVVQRYFRFRLMEMERRVLPCGPEEHRDWPIAYFVEFVILQMYDTTERLRRRLRKRVWTY